MHLFVYVTTGGGVEDTRFEAQDTKKSEAKDTPSKDRPSCGQEQDCSRPRTKDTALKCSPKIKKRSSPKTFANFPQIAGDLKKKVFAYKFANFPQKPCVKFFFSQVLWRSPRRKYIAHDLLTFSTGQKTVLSSSRGQGIFQVKDLTFEAKDLKLCPWGRPQSQGRPQGLHLWSQHRRSQGGAQGAWAPPNQNTTNDKKLWQHSLAMFSCSFFSVIMHITVINNNINDNKRVPGPPTNNQGALESLTDNQEVRDP